MRALPRSLAVPCRPRAAFVALALGAVFAGGCASRVLESHVYAAGECAASDAHILVEAVRWNQTRSETRVTILLTAGALQRMEIGVDGILLELPEFSLPLSTHALDGCTRSGSVVTVMPRARCSIELVTTSSIRRASAALSLRDLRTDGRVVAPLTLPLMQQPLAGETATGTTEDWPDR